MIAAVYLTVVTILFIPLFKFSLCFSIVQIVELFISPGIVIFWAVLLLEMDVMLDITVGHCLQYAACSQNIFMLG